LLDRYLALNWESSERAWLFPLFGVDAGGVLLKNVFTAFDRILRRLESARPEHIAGPNSLKPPLKLDQVDFILFEFGVGEVIGLVFLADLLEEVRTLVDDLLVLVVSGRVERVNELVLTGQRGGAEQGRPSAHFLDLCA